MRLRLASPRKAEKIDSAREREVRPPPPARDAEKGEVRRAGSRGSRTRRIRGGEPSLSFLWRTAGKIAPLHEIPPNFRAIASSRARRQFRAMARAGLHADTQGSSALLAKGARRSARSRSSVPLTSQWAAVLAVLYDSYYAFKVNLR